jgi:hypothetical protein
MERATFMVSSGWRSHAASVANLAELGGLRALRIESLLLPLQQMLGRWDEVAFVAVAPLVSDHQVLDPVVGMAVYL